jgi:ribosome biogenesis GTPase
MVSQADPSSCALEEILPRRNVFVRADSRQRTKIVASNLDRVFVVIAPRPEPSQDLVERYLVAIHSLGIEPEIVLNKTELMPEMGPFENSPLGRSKDYRELGYEVVQTSCKAEPGVSELAAILKETTSILVGQSGVGKSSLVNHLLPDLELQTGALSRATGKGTHTTTATTMYSLPSGGRLIDSPGVWEYGLWQMSQDELEGGFVEFLPFLGKCRFNDCRHQTEPDCSIREAVSAGKIPKWRYQSYLRLVLQSG